MTPLNGAIADELVRQGVTRVFGLLGEDVVRLAVELVDRGIEFVDARHESHAVGMADGFARVSGELAVVLISRGPGVTNALTALATAAKARNRIVVLTGDCDPSIRGTVYSKWIDQRVLFEGAGVPFVTLDSPGSAVADLAAVFECARTGEVVVAQLPGTILEAEAGTEPSRAVLPAGQPEGGAAARNEIVQIADLLAETWAFARPVVLAGRGAYWSGARDDLVRLADLTGALLATTLMARSMFAGEPFDVGIAGTYSTEPAVELLPQADLVLAFGSTLDPLTTMHGAMFPNARVIRFERDPAKATAGSVPVELFVEADARLAAAALVDELERRGHRFEGYRTAAVREQLAGYRAGDSIVDQGGDGTVDPRLLMLRLDELLPKNRTLVADNGHHTAFSTAYLSVPDPSAWISPLEFHCVGAAAGMAIGAALARPDRQTVYCVGDCGALMTMGDLETIARLGLPLIVIVVNDSALGAELQYLRALGIRDEIASCPTPSFEEVGRALGYDAYTVTSLDDLPALAGVLERPARPVLVDCRVTADVQADWLGIVMLGQRPVDTQVAP